MFEDTMKTIKAMLYERISSPLLGTFVLSWCLWNYRFLIIIFSTIPVSDKFNLIDAIIFPSQKIALLKGMAYPLMTTAFFIYVYPYPAKKVYEFWRARQKDLKEARQRIEDEEPLTREEATMIRSEMYRMTKEHQEEITKRDAEIERIRDIYTALNKEKPQYVPNEHSLFLVELTELQKYKNEVIYFFGLFKNSSESYESTIMQGLTKKFGCSKVVSEFILGELVAKNLVVRNYNQEMRMQKYELTHSGRRMALQLGVGNEDSSEENSRKQQ